MTYGVQNAICANSIVTKPRSMWNVMNSSINPMAVTISGFMIGKSFSCSTAFLSTLRQRDRPMALIVPSSVETRVAISAMTIVVCSDSIMSRFSNIRSYHMRLKPSKLVSERPELKEKMIMNRIGT